MPRATFTYRNNTTEAAGHRQPALWAAIDLSGHGAMDRVEALPIYRTARLLSDGRVAQLYQTLVAGVAIERASLEELETSIDHYMGLLVHYGRLPEYLFQLGDRAWPIYRLEDQLMARFPGSRTFSAPTIGELRNELADHFKQVGVIDYRKGMTVLYLSRQDFQPDTPVCTLRAPGLAEMPVFRDKETVVHLVAPVNGRSIVTELAGGEGLLVLPGLVGDYLADRGRLAESDSIGVRKLSATVWAAAARGLHPYTCSFFYTDRSGGGQERREIPIFADETRGRLVAARTNRMGRVSLHFAQDIPHLQFKVGEELTEIGKIPVPTYVTINGIEESVHAQYLEARGSSTWAPLAL